MGQEERHNRREARRDNRLERKVNRLERKRDRKGERRRIKIDRKIDRLEHKRDMIAYRANRGDSKDLARREADEAAPMTAEEFKRNELRERGKDIWVRRNALQERYDELDRQIASTSSETVIAELKEQQQGVKRELKRAKQEWAEFRQDYNTKRDTWKGLRNRKWRKMSAEEFVTTAYVDDTINAGHEASDVFPSRREDMDARAGSPDTSFEAARKSMDLNDPVQIAQALLYSDRSPQDLRDGDPMALRALGLDPDTNAGRLAQLANLTEEEYSRQLKIQSAYEENEEAGSVFLKIKNTMERMGPLAVLGTVGAAAGLFMYRKSLPDFMKPVAIGAAALVGIPATIYLGDMAMEQFVPGRKGIFDYLIAKTSHPDKLGNSDNLQSMYEEFAVDLDSPDELDVALATKDLKLRDFIPLAKEAIRSGATGPDEPNKYIERKFGADVNRMSADVSKDVDGPEAWNYFQQLIALAAERGGSTLSSFGGDHRQYLEFGLDMLSGYPPDSSLVATNSYLRGAKSPQWAERTRSLSPEQMQKRGDLTEIFAKAGYGSFDVFRVNQDQVMINGWVWDIQPTTAPAPKGFELRSSLSNGDDYKGRFTLDGDHNLDTVKTLVNLSEKFIKQEAARRWKLKPEDLRFDQEEDRWQRHPAYKTNATGEAFVLEIVNPTGEKLQLRPRSLKDNFPLPESFDTIDDAKKAFEAHSDEQARMAAAQAKALEDKAKEPSTLENAANAYISFMQAGWGYAADVYRDWRNEWPISVSDKNKEQCSDLSPDEIQQIREYAIEGITDAYDEARKIDGNIDAALDFAKSTTGLGDRDAYDRLIDLTIASESKRIEAILSNSKTIKTATLRKQIDKVVKDAMSLTAGIKHYQGPNKYEMARVQLAKRRYASNAIESQTFADLDQETVAEGQSVYIDSLIQKYDLESVALGQSFKASAERRLDQLFQNGRSNELPIFRKYLEDEAEHVFGLLVKVKKEHEQNSANRPHLTQAVNWLGIELAGGTVVDFVDRIIHAFTPAGSSELEKIVGTVDSVFWAHWSSNQPADTSNIPEYRAKLGPAFKNSLDVVR